MAGTSQAPPEHLSGADKTAPRTSPSPAEGATTRRFYYSDQWQVLEEYVGNSTTPEVRYWYGIRDINDIVRRQTLGAGATDLYALRDTMNVVALINASGVVQQRMAYDAFGNTRCLTSAFAAGSNAAGWNLLFHGNYRDADTGLYQMRFRYYHPNLGVWLSRDPIRESGGLNMVAFTSQRPLMMSDFLGLAYSPPPGCDCDYNQGYNTYGKRPPQGTREQIRFDLGRAQRAMGDALDDETRKVYQALRDYLALRAKGVVPGHEDECQINGVWVKRVPCWTLHYGSLFECEQDNFRDVKFWQNVEKAGLAEALKIATEAFLKKHGTAIAVGVGFGTALKVTGQAARVGGFIPGLFVSIATSVIGDMIIDSVRGIKDPAEEHRTAHYHCVSPVCPDTPKTRVNQ